MKLKLFTFIVIFSFVTTVTYAERRNWLVGIVNQTDYTLFIRSHDPSGMTFSQNFDIGSITPETPIHWRFHPSRGDMYELGRQRMCFLKETPIPWASLGDDNRIFADVGRLPPYTGFNIQERNEVTTIYKRDISATGIIGHIYPSYKGRFVAIKQSGKDPNDPAFHYFQVKGKHVVNEHNVPLQTGEEYVLIVKQREDKVIVLNIRPLTARYFSGGIKQYEPLKRNCSGLPCRLPTEPMYWTRSVKENPDGSTVSEEEFGL